MKNPSGIVCAQGAGLCGAVAVGRLRPYMTERMSERLDRMEFVPTHALIAAFPYYMERGAGNIAIYARGADYVRANLVRLSRACAVLAALYPENRFHPTGNAYPLPAVHAARLAELGRIGAHGMIITKEFGSFVTLGAILTDLALEDDGGDAGFCEACGGCVRACPTGALSLEGGTRTFDKSVCLSFITQEKDLSEKQTELLSRSGTVLGCDICQLACPHNRRVRVTPLPEYHGDRISRLTAADLEASGGRRFEKKTELILRNLEIISQRQP